MLQGEEAVSHSEVSRAAEPVSIVEGQPKAPSTSRFSSASPLSWRILLAVPAAAFVVLGLHFFISKKEPSIETRSYALLIAEFIAVSFVLTALQPFWAGLRRWMRHMCPILTGAILLLGLWDVVTSGFRLL